MEGTERVIGGRYRLLTRLGSGTTGHVWRAEDVLLRRQVAVKEIVLAPGTRPEEAEVLRERTRREARSAARLHHQSVVAVYDVVDEDGRPWLVMELVEARTLAEVVAQDGPLSPARTAQVGLALLGALDAAHARGIVHRDVKPGNVLLCSPERGDGRVVLSDFGIATTEGDAALTSTGLLLGSPAYIAPERARGLAPGPASDLWSLGATLFTAVEGTLPYDGRDALETVTAVVTGVHTPFVQAGPLAHVLTGLLEKDPDLRTGAADARALLVQVARSADDVPAARPPTLRPESPASLTAALPLTEHTTSSRRTSADASPRLARPTRRPTGLDTPAGAGAPTGQEEASSRRTARRPWRRRPAAPAAAGLALLAVAAGGWAVWSQVGDPPRIFRAAPAVATPSAAPPASLATAPAGWRTFTDPAGWSLSLPADFVSVPRRPGEVNLRSDDRGLTLRVYVTPAREDPQRTLAALAAGRADALPDYRELTRRAVDDPRGDQAAEQEFTWTAKDGTPLHVLDRVMVTGGVQYELYWQARARDWAATRSVFSDATQTFRPAPDA